MRLDSDVIAWLKADGRGYQTKANWLLRHTILNFTGEKVLASRRVLGGAARPRKTMLGLHEILGE
jgi:BrnA antitoxin of type II toxin-antitoxin system